MKKFINIKILSIGLVLAFCFVNIATALTGEASNSLAKKSELSAKEILENADRILAPDCFIAEMTMTAYHSNGESREYRMKTYRQSKDKVLVVFSYPNIENGRKILRLNDDIWMYMPSVKKSIKVSSKEQLLGGDFTNGDVTRLDLAEDYLPEITSRKEDKYYSLRLKAKNNSISYDQILYQINKNDFMPIKQKYFTSSNKLIKELTFDKVENYGGFSRPNVFVMTNKFVKSKKTELTYTSFKIVNDIDDFYFKKASLGDY